MAPHIEIIDEEYSFFKDAKIEEIASRDYQFAHEAGVWLPEERRVLFTSNQFLNSAGKRIVEIGFINVDTYKVETITPEPPIILANGATNYRGKVLVCEQGDHNNPPALTLLDPKAPWKNEKLITDYHGSPFNSPNDVVILPLDDTIWFTDPSYAYLQQAKSEQSLPHHVYCFDPNTKKIRVVTDDVETPNGIAFSPDYSQCYITDTSSYVLDSDAKEEPWKGKAVSSNKASIYVFDVVPVSKTISDKKFTLANRRLFAFAATPAPDGIKVDTDGNVYAGCGDGIHVWNQHGEFVARFSFEGGVANFVFTDRGTIIAFNETKIFKISGIETIGALDYSL